MVRIGPIPFQDTNKGILIPVSRDRRKIEKKMFLEINPESDDRAMGQMSLAVGTDTSYKQEDRPLRREELKP